MNLLQAIDDPHLFGPWFRHRETWAAWRVFIAALFGHGMTDDEIAVFRQCTGREHPPADPAKEGWLIIGRRGGKSFVLALLAVFLACFRDYSIYLAPGERATLLVIAADRKQARVIMRYVKGLIAGVPMLARMIETERKESFDLTNRVTIEVATASFRTVRGYALCAALCDELAFWPAEDSANPDREVLDALRPAMLTIPNAMLLCASSPYARRGALWDARQKHYGHDGPALVWQAPTSIMNPTIPQEEIDAEYERDPAVAAAEYGAEFRRDLQSYVDRDAVEACIARGVRERPYERRWEYYAFTDPSGGAVDSMTLAIAHRENKTAVLDAVREWKPPFSPESVVEEAAALLGAYHIVSVRGDRYGGEWPREVFQRRGITYRPSEKVRSELYRDCLPLINSGLVSLLDHPKLVTQLVNLERRTGRGKDVIDHPPGGHDDVVNSVAGALDWAWTEGEWVKPVRRLAAGRISDPLAAFR